MTVLDLFAGPGGWEVAAAALDLDVVGLENDAAACATRRNAGHVTVCADVAHYRVPAPLDGLIASPPCPTFSKNGDRDGIADLPRLVAHVQRCVDGWHDYTPPRGADPRSELVLEPLRYALVGVPEWIALEQVPEVLPVWEAMGHVLRACGWSTWTGILEAERYGVPQTRDRAFLMASRSGVVQPPEPTHQRYVKGEPARHDVTMFGEIRPWVSMAEAFGWNAHDGEHEDGPVPHAIDCDLDGDCSCGVDGMTDQLVLNTGRDWKPGGDRMAAQQIPITEPAPALDGEHSGASRWWWHQPATTVADHRISARVHHDEGMQGRDARTLEDVLANGGYDGTTPLKLTLRDALVLQSFPADYPVAGTKMKQFQQIGNAVPPLLARAVLEALTR